MAAPPLLMAGLVLLRVGSKIIAARRNEAASLIKQGAKRIKKPTDAQVKKGLKNRTDKVDIDRTKMSGKQRSEELNRPADMSAAANRARIQRLQKTEEGPAEIAKTKRSEAHRKAAALRRQREEKELAEARARGEKIYETKAEKRARIRSESYENMTPAMREKIRAKTETLRKIDSRKGSGVERSQKGMMLPRRGETTRRASGGSVKKNYAYGGRVAKMSAEKS